MGNFIPSLVHCTNVPTTSKLAKHKLQCYTVVLSRLYKFKKSKSASNNTIESTNKGDGPNKVLMAKDDQATQTTNQDQRGVIRVKVLLTKKEAAKLISMSVKGDKTIGQIMNELKKIDLHEKSLGSRNAAAWRPVLESIPEDSLVPCT